MTGYHLTYYRLLDAFAKCRVRKLIVTMPPQHGKSTGASTLLPAYLLGRNPDLRLAIASASSRFAAKLSRGVQRVMDGDIYRALFPDTALSHGRTAANDAIRQGGEFEIIGRKGSLLAVGRGGMLTGNRVDCLILDDLYKDAEEANSPIVRENCWEWYTSVVKTRMHNTSQELIVFTRWHEEDLIGTLTRREAVVEFSRWEQLENLPPDTWLYLNFEALKTGKPSEIDPRKPGEALWPKQHSEALLLGKRALDPLRFECMYQGNPTAREGLLYGDGFDTYEEITEPIVRRANYTDTADMGGDYLCSICYAVGKSGKVYVLDVLYSDAPMEETEPATAEMILRNDVRSAAIESNNGGRGFARTIQRLCPAIAVKWFHQSGNKEARILTASASVAHNIIMPANWHRMWPTFHSHVMGFKRAFKANRHDDAADVLTGIVEAEVVGKNSVKISII